MFQRSRRGRRNQHMLAVMAIAARAHLAKALRVERELQKPVRSRAQFRRDALISVILRRKKQGVISAVTNKAFQRFISVDTISLTTLSRFGSRAIIETPEPIVALHFILSVTTTETTATGVVEDAVQRYLRQIILSDGGEPRQTIGDGGAGTSAAQMLESVDRGWLQKVPHLTQVADGGNEALWYGSSPIAAPYQRYGRDVVNRSALRVGNVKTWNVRAQSGALADLRSTVGDVAVTDASLEVIAEVDEDLDKTYAAVRKTGMGEPIDLFTNMETLSLATAGTNAAQNLATNGTMLMHALLQNENSLRSRTILTTLRYKVNGSQIVSEGSWASYENQAEVFGALDLNVPVGRAFANFDNKFNLGGIPVAGATGWKAELTIPEAGTGAAGDGLNVQGYYVTKHGKGE